MIEHETILVVDDNPDNLSVMKKVLSKAMPDVEVVILQQPEAAMDLIRSMHCALAVVDIQMPGINGVELCRRIKESEDTKSLPVILVTSHDAPGKLKAEGLEAGADDFLFRPMNNAEMVARLRVGLRIGRAETALRRALKQTEASLQASEARFGNFMDSATEGFVLYDSQLNLVAINKSALAVFPDGCSEESLKGRNILEIAPDMKEPDRYDRYLNVVRTGEPFAIDDLVPHPKFGNRHLSVKAFRVGEGLGMAISDVTERRLGCV